MKKFLAVVLSVLMIMSLAACGESSTPATATVTEVATTAAAEIYNCMITVICCEEGWIGIVFNSEEIIYRPTDWNYDWEVRQTLPVIVKGGEITSINGEGVVFIEHYGPQSEYQGRAWYEDYERRCLRQDLQ